MIEVRRYRRLDGEVPLTDSLAAMRDARARAKLEIGFRRVSLGIFGDIKPVGEGVLELREDIGPGYRVYLGRHGATLVILHCGGDKRTRDVDIKRAKEYWSDWKRRNTWAIVNMPLRYRIPNRPSPSCGLIGPLRWST